MPIAGRSGIKGTLCTVALLMLTLAVALLVVGCGDGSGSDTTATTSGSGGDTVQVIMKDTAFDPETLTIKVGQTVTWLNEDAPQHDVVARDGAFKSDKFDKGGTFSFTFEEPGTYPYYCSIHPGMEGEVIVE